MAKERVMPGLRGKTPRGFGELERAVADCLGADAVSQAAIDNAWKQAVTAFDAGGAGRAAGDMALLVFTTELFAGHAVELTSHGDELSRLIERVDSVAGIPAGVLGRQVLQSPALLALPSPVAIQVELTLLLGFTDLQALSLWTVSPGGDLRHIGHAGSFDPEAFQTRRLARRLLNEGSVPPEDARDVAGVIVTRGERTSAALAGRGDIGSCSDRIWLLEAAVPIVRAMLERDELLARVSGSDQARLETTERRLARVRFDLHDGPQQDVILLAEDLGLFRSQLESTIDGHPHRNRLLGRLEDLQARLVALDGDLRRISVAVKSPFLQPQPLPDALAQLTDDFASRTGIEPDTRLQGEFDNLTDSQQIALLGLIREALSNVREHSDAQRVTIELSADENGIEATVTDDGHGFDPEVTLVQAAREGHLGLVGMHERVRLLGGRTQIDSRPGGPTVISTTLPIAPAGIPRQQA